MANIKINFETLYDALRNERNRVELQKLEDSFYEDIIIYLEEKTAILSSQESKKSVFTISEVQKTRKQIESIQKIIKEIYTARENKIIQSALIASKTNNQVKGTENMLKEEKRFYEETMYVFNNYRENILHNLINGQNITIKQKIEPKNLKDKEMPTKTTKNIKFIKEVPSFVGTNLIKHGPFEKEDRAQIPTEIANLLIKSKKAIENENT